MATEHGSVSKRRHGKTHTMMHWLRAAVSMCRGWGRLPIVLLFCVVIILWLTWYIPYLFPKWRSVASRLFAEQLLFVVALSGSLVCLLFWLLFLKLPRRQVRYVFDVKERVDLELKARQTMAQIVGGAVLLVGLYFTSQTLRTTQEGQITDRFTKAINQLGKNDLAVRLGAIHALERIARDSEYDHWAVMEVLTAFVREQPYRSLFSRFFPEKPEVSKLPADMQAILTVLGRRIRTYGKGESERLDLSGVQLPSANLAGAKLQGANLTGANLSKAHLGGAHEKPRHVETKFNSDRPFIATITIEHVFQPPDFQGAILTGARLQQAILVGALFQGAILVQAMLQDSDLTKAKFKNADLAEAHLEGATLTEAHLEGATLIEAHLEGALLTGAHLEGAILTEAHLEGAILTEAHLEGATLIEAHLEGALLTGAHLDSEQIRVACVDEHTQLPDGLTRPAPCPANP
jgi:uncharacterized protein YjbI with pentapeptide repeats